MLCLLLEYAKQENRLTVLEGIETADDLAIASELGVDLVQGYYFRLGIHPGQCLLGADKLPAVALSGLRCPQLGLIWKNCPSLRRNKKQGQHGPGSFRPT